jgi:hypothetical protein
MLSESLIIGLVVLLLCGAVSFYIYARMMYAEKKLTVMESILVDMRVALDSIMTERQGHPASIPIAHTPGGEVPGPTPGPEAPAAETDVSGGTASQGAPGETEEKFYSAVLDQAHDITAEVTGVGLEEGGAAAASAASAAAAASAPAAAPVAFEKMSRPELVSYAEKNGFRVKKSMSRGEIESMLRRAAAAQNATPSTGTENVSGSMEGPSENGAPLSGDATMDSGVLLESTI